MSELFGALFGQGAGQTWLVTANLVLSILLAAQMLRNRRLHMEARESQANTMELIDNLSEGIYRTSPDGRWLKVNRALVRLSGFESKERLLAEVRDIGKEWYAEPGRRDEIRAILESDGKLENAVSEIYRPATGERVWITESVRVVSDKKSGKPLFYEGSVHEITETMARLHLEEMFQKLTTQVPGGLFQLIRYKGGRLTAPYVSSGCRRITGFGDNDEHPDPLAFVNSIHSDDRQRFLETLRLSGTRMVPWDCEFRATSGEGTESWLRVTATPESIADGIMWHGYVDDISVRKDHEMEIEKLAFFDPLTGLPNRRLLHQRTASVGARCAETGNHGALLFIDLDNFKTLNDTMGHNVGDEFLVQVSTRLSACVERNDTVARMGGDEFVIVLENAGGDRSIATRHAIVTANKVLSCLREKFRLGELDHRTSASIGVVVFDGIGYAPEDIMKNADMAMYQAKSAGRNGVAMFDPVSMTAEADRFRLLADLREAIANRNLILHYQPQISDAGIVTGAEALVRWNHPDRGFVQPSDFVHLADQFGLADELAKSVLEAGAETLARWMHDPRTAQLNLSVNISAPSIRGEAFAPFLAGLIERHRFEPHKLTLEVTEHVMAKDQTLVARRMKELKKLGVRLSLDDFGSGHSSIAYLKKLPFDELKIDGCFVADIEHSDSDRALVKSMLSMAATLGLAAAAEHVETMQQEAFLRAYGCDYFQGWYYSPALTAEEFGRYVFERNPTPVIAFPGTRHQA